MNTLLRRGTIVIATLCLIILLLLVDKATSKLDIEWADRELNVVIRDYPDARTTCYVLLNYYSAEAVSLSCVPWMELRKQQNLLEE